MSQMSGKTVLITGASRGIGAATAQLFAALGANVGLFARSRAPIEGLAAQLGENALALPGDVADFGAVEQAVATCTSAFGKVDVLINNAGVIEPISSLMGSDPQAWGQAIDINLKGVYNGMRAVLPQMVARGQGTILTVSSGAAHNPLEGWSHYCTGKAGAAMLTKCAHREAAGQGIRVMGLSPGTVATEMQREIKASGINPVAQLEWNDHIPAEWPARALAWMCSKDADEFVGQEISLRDEEIRNRIGLND